LPVLLSIAELAKLAGQQQPQAIADWARLRPRPLCRLFGLWRHALPVLKTWNCVFQSVDVGQLDQLVCAFLQESLFAPPREGRLCVAMDGKTLRGTI